MHTWEKINHCDNLNLQQLKPPDFDWMVFYCESKPCRQILADLIGWCLTVLTAEKWKIVDLVRQYVNVAVVATLARNWQMDGVYTVMTRFTDKWGQILLDVFYWPLTPTCKSWQIWLGDALLLQKLFIVIIGIFDYIGFKRTVKFDKQLVIL